MQENSENDFSFFFKKKKITIQKTNNKPTKCNVCGATVTCLNKARRERTSKHNASNFVQFLCFERK